MLKAYLISLPRNGERLAAASRQLARMPYIDASTSEAFDGHVLSSEQMGNVFDTERLMAREGRKVRPGEIGCTMSHQQVYRTVARGDDEWSMVLEDDFVIPDGSAISAPLLADAMARAEGPAIILLSGWHWWTDAQPLSGEARLVDVWLGHLSHAYLINRAAAQRLITDRPYFFADDWHLFRRLGVRVYGIVPHLIDQDWSGTFVTEVNDEEKHYGPFSLRRALNWLGKSLRLKYLSLTNRFEKPQL